jgi:hypothetical protein
LHCFVLYFRGPLLIDHSAIVSLYLSVSCHSAAFSHALSVSYFLAIASPFLLASAYSERCSLGPSVNGANAIALPGH